MEKKIPVTVLLFGTPENRYGQVNIGEAEYVASVTNKSALMWRSDVSPATAVENYASGFSSMSDAVDWVVGEIPILNSRRDLLAFQYIGG